MADYQIKSKSTGKVYDPATFIQEAQKANPGTPFTESDLEPFLQQHADSFERVPGKYNPNNSTLSRVWDTATGAASSVIPTILDVGRGVRASFYKPVATISENLGYDPKEVKLPNNITDIPQWIRQGPTHFTGDSETLDQVSTTPQNAAGTVGNVSGQVLQLLRGGKLTEKVPELLTKKLGPGLVGAGVRAAVRLPIDAALAGGQTYLQTGDKDQAKDAAKWGAVLSPVVSAAGEVRNARRLESAGKQYLGQMSATSQIPVNNETIPVQREIARRGIAMGTDLSEKAAKDAGNRAHEISEALLQASNKAEQAGRLSNPDIIQRELDKIPGHLDPDTEKVYRDYAQKLMDHYFPIDASTGKRISKTPT